MGRKIPIRRAWITNMGKRVLADGSVGRGNRGHHLPRRPRYPRRWEMYLEKSVIHAAVGQPNYAGNYQCQGGEVVGDHARGRMGGGMPALRHERRQPMVSTALGLHQC